MRDSGLDFLGYIPALPVTSCVDLGNYLTFLGFRFFIRKVEYI